MRYTDDELYHWAIGKKQPKYLMKIGEGKNARYLYTPEEVAAYKNGGKIPNKSSKSEPKSAHGKKIMKAKEWLFGTVKDFGKLARGDEEGFNKSRTGRSLARTKKNIDRTIKDLDTLVDKGSKEFMKTNTGKKVKKSKAYQTAEAVKKDIDDTVNEYGRAMSGRDAVENEKRVRAAGSKKLAPIKAERDKLKNDQKKLKSEISSLASARGVAEIKGDKKAIARYSSEINKKKKEKSTIESSIKELDKRYEEEGMKVLDANTKAAIARHEATTTKGQVKAVIDTYKKRHKKK